MGFAGCVCWTCQTIVCVNYQTDVIRLTSWKNFTSLLTALLTIHWISLAGLPTSTHCMQHIILSQYYLKGIYTIQCTKLVLVKIKLCCFLHLHQLCWFFTDLQLYFCFYYMEVLYSNVIFILFIFMTGILLPAYTDLNPSYFFL